MSSVWVVRKVQIARTYNTPHMGGWVGLVEHGEHGMMISAAILAKDHLPLALSRATRS